MANSKDVKVTITGEDGEYRVFNDFAEARDYIDQMMQSEQTFKDSGYENREDCIAKNAQNLLLSVMIVDKGYVFKTEEVEDLKSAILKVLHELWTEKSIRLVTLYSFMNSLIDAIKLNKVDVRYSDLNLSTWVLAVRDLYVHGQLVIEYDRSDRVYFIGLPKAQQRGEEK